MTNSPKDPLDGEAVTPTGQPLRTIQYSAPDVDAPPDWPDQQSFFARLSEQLAGQLAFPVLPKRVFTTVIHTAEQETVEFYADAIAQMVKAPNYHYVCSTRRPKRSDISDEQVIQAAIDSRAAFRKRDLSFSPDSVVPRPLDTSGLLRDRTGHPRKVVLAAILRAQRRGYVESGVSVETSWPTPKGERFLATKDLRDRISELEKKLREARKAKPPVEPEHPGELSPEQHYDLAETTLAATGGFPYGSDELGDMLAEAQVHATLATYRKAEK